MTLSEFRESVQLEKPPANLGVAVTGLWWDGRGDWNRAHEAAQQDEGPAGAWVHAYLHRKQGDDSNARYWYRRAQKPACKTSLEEEWGEIAASLLRDSTRGE